MERAKAFGLKGWFESPNALRWRLGQFLGCAFTETKSSKIIIGKLGPVPLPNAEGGLPGTISDDVRANECSASDRRAC
jgi:hypothetical protein